MWVARQDSHDFQQEYAIETKLLDARSEENTLEIFKSHSFGQIALINQKQLLLQNHLASESETLAHISLCTHPEPRRILILGGFNLQIAFEALRHENVCVDFLCKDRKILESLITFFPNYQETLNHARFSLLDHLDAKAHYDIILHQETPLSQEVSLLLENLTPEGIMILRLQNLILHRESTRTYLTKIAPHFTILMPYTLPLSIITDQHYLFASRRFHPLADLNLQRADMLEGLSFYHALLHQSTFVLPRFLQESFKGILKN